MAICKFCGIPFSSVSSVCDHLELYHDDTHDICPGKELLFLKFFISKYSIR
jgi:hypothetical protein